MPSKGHPCHGRAITPIIPQQDRVPKVKPFRAFLAQGLIFWGTTLLIVDTWPRLSLNPGDYCFTHSLRVRFAETDAMGIVHHSRYLPYLEEARVEYLRSVGHPYTENRQNGFDFAVLESHLRYRAPLRFDDVVTVHLQPVEFTGATFTLDYLLTSQQQSPQLAVCTVARTVHAYVDSTGRPHRLPSWIKELVPK